VGEIFRKREENYKNSTVKRIGKGRKENWN
jgi:hypothetical protein